MTHATPTRKTTRTPATCCARCGTQLKNPGTVVLGIGVVGPECLHHVQNALADLAQGPLAVLVAQGEVRLTLQKTSEGNYIVPQDALSQYCVSASRAGISLQGRIEPGVYVLTIKARSLQGYSVRSVQA